MLIHPFSLRHYIALFREDQLLDTLRSRLSNVKAHSFTVVDIEPYHKDGGAFVTFDFTASDAEDALKTIEAELKEEAKAHGGFPSWLGGGGGVWLVKGKPWIEVVTEHVNISSGSLLFPSRT